MTVRFALLPVALALTAASAPAPAQNSSYEPGAPPPLPRIADEEWDPEWAEYLDDAARIPRERPVSPQNAATAPARLPPLVWQRGYSEEQRSQWLEQCRWSYAGDPLDHCEDYLIRYEQSFLGRTATYLSRGDAGPPHPVVWVRVPVSPQ